MREFEGNLAVGAQVVERPLVIEITPAESAELPLLALECGNAVELSDIVEQEPVAVEIAEHTGSVVLASEVVVAEEVLTEKQARSRNLLEATKNAREGNAAARDMVRQNVATDSIERRFKQKQTINVRIDVGVDGEWSQNGQNYDQVHANSEQYISDPILKPRVAIESANKSMIIEAYNQGLLVNNAIVITSRVKDGISPNIADKIGWFGDTMSVAQQLIYQEGGQIIIESNFLAGADERGAERFDRESCERVADQVFAIDLTGLTAEEMLARPIIVPKEKLPAVYSSDGELMMRGGALVEAYDGKERFFGTIHVGEKDYKAHLDACRQCELNASVEIEQVTEQLIRESDKFIIPTDATKRLDQLNDAILKKAVITDLSIDLRVLGPAAAPHIELARLHYQNGDLEKLELEYGQVKKLGNSSSCPAGIRTLELEGDTNDSASKVESDDFGPLEFKCQKGHTNKRLKGGWVYNCKTCGVDTSCGRKPSLKTVKERRPIHGSIKTKSTGVKRHSKGLNKS